MKILLQFFLFAVGILPAHQIEPLSHKPEEVLLHIAQYLPENPVILECGGCNGEDTIRMANNWPKGTIHTFEVVPELFEEIKKRTITYPNVFPYKIALSEKSEKKIFYLSTLDTNIGASSLLPPSERLSLFDGAKFEETIFVNALTLDDWGNYFSVDHIDFMWLDMQGTELNMLKISELAQSCSVIYTEVEFIEIYEGQYLYEDIKKWMFDHGFVLVALDFQEEIALKDPSLIQPGNGIPYAGNALFVKKTLTD